MRWKELPAELKDRIMSRFRSGENSAALKIPKSTVAFLCYPFKVSLKSVIVQINFGPNYFIS